MEKKQYRFYVSYNYLFCVCIFSLLQRPADQRKKIVVTCIHPPTLMLLIIPNPNTVHVYLRIILKHFKQVQNARALTHACPALAVCAARFYRARACSCRRTFVVETPCKAPCETKMKKNIEKNSEPVKYRK